MRGDENARRVHAAAEQRDVVKRDAIQRRSAADATRTSEPSPGYGLGKPTAADTAEPFAARTSTAASRAAAVPVQASATRPTATATALRIAPMIVAVAAPVAYASVAVDLDQTLVADTEVVRDLVEDDAPDLAAQALGVRCP